MVTRTTGPLRDRVEVRSIAITGLFVLAVLYTLYFPRVPAAHQAAERGALGAPAQARSGRDPGGAGVLVVDLGCGRRIHRGAVARHVKIFCDHIESLTPIGEFLGK